MHYRVQYSVYSTWIRNEWDGQHVDGRHCASFCVLQFGNLYHCALWSSSSWDPGNSWWKWGKDHVQSWTECAFSQNPRQEMVPDCLPHIAEGLHGGHTMEMGKLTPGVPLQVGLLVTVGRAGWVKHGWQKQCVRPSSSPPM